MDRDSNVVFEHYIPLEAWQPVPAMTVGLDPAGEHECGNSDVADTLPDGGPVMNKLREVGIRFYQLSFSKKSEIAGRLDLLEDEDMSQPDFERFRRVFIRAQERGKLDLLAEAVRVAEEGS